MRIFYKTLLCFSAVLVTLVSCSFDEMGDQITLENHKLNISFDREKFDFKKLKEVNELDPIDFDVLLEFEPILDTTVVDLSDLKFEQITDNFLVDSSMIPPENLEEFDSDAGTQIDAQIFDMEPSEIIPQSGEQQFEWARIDTGRFNITVTNNFHQVIFEKIDFTLKNDRYETILQGTFVNLEAGSTQSINNIRLDHKLITDTLFLNQSVQTPVISAADNHGDVVWPTDALNFSYSLGQSTIDSAKASFDPVKREESTTHQIDINNIIARNIAIKDGEIKFKAINNTALKLDVHFAINGLKNADTGETYYKMLDVQPNSSSGNTTTLDNWNLTFGTDQGIPIKDSITCSTPVLGQMIVFHKTDKVSFITTLSAKNSLSSGLLPLKIKSVDGRVSGSGFELGEDPQSLGDDFNWDEFSGINVDQLTAELKLDVNRNDLKFETISFADFKIQGRKRNGQHSDFSLTIPSMTNVNDTTVIISGFENVINFKPDTLVFSGKAVASFDGIIYDTDVINMTLGFGLPITINTTVPEGSAAITQKSDIDSIDALNDSEDLNIEAVYINLDAFINNPKKIDAKMRLTVMTSDKLIHKNGTTVLTDSLAGNVTELVVVNIQKDYNGSSSYMLSDLSGKPISLDKNTITSMLKSKTYIQQTLEVISQGPGHPIVMKPEDYIEVQLKLSGDVDITFDTK